MKRVFALVIVVFIAAVVVAAGFRYRTAEPPEERVIQITAKKFDFTPGEITVKKGETVIFELKSSDRAHGFNIPDFKVRSDVKPGETTRLKFTADKTGTFPISCDVFCGSGHEDMSGTLKVTE